MLRSSEIQCNWNPRFFEQGGLFEVFKDWQDWFLLHPDAFPDLDALTQLAHQNPRAPVLSGGGFPVRFIRQQRLQRQNRASLDWRSNYQLRIFLSGEVPSRPNNWHDFFNAWTWIYLPKVKATINWRHFQCIEESSGFPWRLEGGNRNREQDMLTLFDEGGMLVVTDNDELWDLIVRRQWKQIFCERFDELESKVNFVPVGHALFECALQGHPRLHASCVRVRCPSTLKAGASNPVELSRFWQRVDECAALEINRRAHLRSPDDLHALPIWGIPGWHPRAGEPAFVADSSYFR